MASGQDIEEWLQQSLLASHAREESIMLEITVPLDADSTVFQIGWSLRGVRSRKWIAIQSGRAQWNIHELATAAQRLESILTVCAQLVHGAKDDWRRD